MESYVRYFKWIAELGEHYAGYVELNTMLGCIVWSTMEDMLKGTPN